MIILCWLYPNTSYQHSLQSGRYEDILPDASFSNSVPVVPPGQRLKVFSEYSDIAEFLTCPSFEVTEDKQQAEIFWLAQRQYNIRYMLPSVINLF